MGQTEIIVAMATIILGITAPVMALVWKMANFLRDRPNNDEFDRLESRVASIEIDVAKQGVIITNIDRNLERLVQKLDHP